MYGLEWGGSLGGRFTVLLFFLMRMKWVWGDEDDGALYKQSLGIFTFHPNPTFVALSIGQPIRDGRASSVALDE